MTPNFLSFCPIFLVGCFLSSGLGVTSIVAQEPATPAAAPVLVTPDANYVLKPGDLLDIRVFREDDMNSQVRIAQDGSISFPLLGPVNVMGLTASSARQKLEKLLDEKYLVNPQLTVSIADYSKRRIVILGQVKSPGAYELPEEDSLDLLQALGLAGGFTDFAAPNRVLVKRVENGSEKMFRLNARDMSTGKERPFPIKAGDIITVTQSFF